MAGNRHTPRDGVRLKMSSSGADVLRGVLQRSGSAIDQLLAGEVTTWNGGRDLIYLLEVVARTTTGEAQGIRYLADLPSMDAELLDREAPVPDGTFDAHYDTSLDEDDVRALIDAGAPAWLIERARLLIGHEIESRSRRS